MQLAAADKDNLNPHADMSSLRTHLRQSTILAEPEMDFKES